MFQLSPEVMTVVSTPALPEVQQFDELRQYLYKDAALSAILRKSQIQLRDVTLADQTQGKCDIANNKLKQAHWLAEQVHMLGLKTPLRIRSQPHHSALDDLAQTAQELEEVLSAILEPAE